MNAAELFSSMVMWNGSLLELRALAQVCAAGDKGLTRHEAIEQLGSNINQWLDWSFDWFNRGLVTRVSEPPHGRRRIRGRRRLRYFATPKAYETLGLTPDPASRILHPASS